MQDLYEPQDEGKGLAVYNGWLSSMEVLWTIGQLLLEGGWHNDIQNYRDVFEKGNSKLLIVMSSLWKQDDLPILFQQIKDERIGHNENSIPRGGGVPKRVVTIEREQNLDGTIFVLHHKSGHWRVALANHSTHIVYHWDPFGSTIEQKTTKALQVAYPEYTMRAIPLVIQTDGFNCGIWVSWCARQFARFVTDEGSTDFKAHLLDSMNKGETQGVRDVTNRGLFWASES
eukprot:768058-Prorocentrum_minimum.AAC.1